MFSLSEGSSAWSAAVSVFSTRSFSLKNYRRKKILSRYILFSSYYDYNMQDEEGDKIKKLGICKNFFGKRLIDKEE